MQPTQLHLVRHGEVDNPDHVVYAALPGFGLSNNGREQARRVAERLSKRPIVAIVASPLDRAQETATIISNGINVAVTANSGLVEWGLGDHWAGIPWDELDARFPGELDAYLQHPQRLDFAPESLEDVARRVASVIDEVAARISGDAVLISHQDPIQAARLHLTGQPLAALQANKPGHCSIVSLTRHTDRSRWLETSYWEPPQGEVFPPIGSPES